ncbi:aldo/keto reductase [Microbacterium sp. NPDC057407]|uniref:aldo/keto reductase n=1 Tax=Microbacterium sp. NPDC057407 TaxID=3346120 RepID=UPI003671D621
MSAQQDSPAGPYRTLGRSGVVVFEQALGTMTFGAEADEATSHEIIDAYVAGGGNFIDTADVYSAGASEEIIGRWLATHPTDAAGIVLATKGRFPMGAGPNGLGTSRRHLRIALDDSLRRLGVEHIDLYQLHAWDPITPLDETLRFLDDAIRQGKIGYYGFSNFLGWQLAKAAMLAERHGWSPPVTLQPQYNLLVRGIEHEIVPAALDAGVGLLPWSPLGGGWLSGKYRRDVPPTGSTRLGENPQRGMEAWEQRNADDRTWHIIDTLTDVAKAHDVSPSQVALAWLGAQPAVTSVILGARSVEQLRDNMGAVELVLEPADLERLSLVSAPQADDYPYGAPGVAQRHREIQGGR